MCQNDYVAEKVNQGSFLDLVSKGTSLSLQNMY